jgi:hypothetical protein
MSSTAEHPSGLFALQQRHIPHSCSLKPKGYFADTLEPQTALMRKGDD